MYVSMYIHVWVCFFLLKNNNLGNLWSFIPDVYCKGIKKQIFSALFILYILLLF